MVLEADISPFFEALVTFLCLEHLAEDIWKGANRVIVDPREHQLRVKAIFVGFSDSKEERRRHGGRVASCTKQGATSFLFVSDLLIGYNGFDFQLARNHVLFSVNEKNFRWWS
jgi:hypothetical protein